MMMMKSKILVNNKEPKIITFPGGERHVDVSNCDVQDTDTHCVIHALLFDSNAIMDLLLACDAVKRICNGNCDLYLDIPYLPYARQDRVANKGEALSVAVMANLINSIGAARVGLLDVHSDVGVALINNAKTMSTAPIIKRIIPNYDVLVAPDAGAEKKVLKLAQAFGMPMEVARKVRDTKTGNIVKTSFVPESNLEDKNVLIVDDIIDGGYTFIKLAEEIKKHDPASIGLYATHGLFSKGIEVFKGYIDEICVANYNDRDIRPTIHHP